MLPEVLLEFSSRTFGRRAGLPHSPAECEIFAPWQRPEIGLECGLLGFEYRYRIRILQRETSGIRTHNRDITPCWRQAP